MIARPTAITRWPHFALFWRCFGGAFGNGGAVLRLGKKSLSY